jgi:hypothetical protein
MGRYIASWALIVVGLVGVVGDLGMGFIASLIDRNPTESERAEYRRIFHAENIEPPRKSGLPQYAAAAASLAVGGVLVWVGLRLRPPAAEPGRGSSKRRKRKAETGGPYPPR